MEIRTELTIFFIMEERINISTTDGGLYPGLILKKILFYYNFSLMMQSWLYVVNPLQGFRDEDAGEVLKELNWIFCQCDSMVCVYAVVE